MAGTCARRSAVPCERDSDVEHFSTCFCDLQVERRSRAACLRTVTFLRTISRTPMTGTHLLTARGHGSQAGGYPCQDHPPTTATPAGFTVPGLFPGWPVVSTAAPAWGMATHGGGCCTAGGKHGTAVRPGSGWTSLDHDLSTYSHECGTSTVPATTAALPPATGSGATPPPLH